MHTHHTPLLPPFHNLYCAAQKSSGGPSSRVSPRTFGWSAWIRVPRGTQPYVFEVRRPPPPPPHCTRCCGGRLSSGPDSLHSATDRRLRHHPSLLLLLLWSRGLVRLGEVRQFPAEVSHVVVEDRRGHGLCRSAVRSCTACRLALCAVCTSCAVPGTPPPGSTAGRWSPGSFLIT